MGTIIQDYKIYRKAKETENSAKTDLETQLIGMVKPISLSELSRYHCTLGVFTTYVKSFEPEKDAKALEKYWNEKAPLVHAPSCFCVLSVVSYSYPRSALGGILVPEVIKEDQNKIKEGDLIRCLHNHENGLIDENCCSNCPKEMFHDLVEYQSLRGQYTDAQNATMLAKQTLFAHFPFIKRKTSH